MEARVAVYLFTRLSWNVFLISFKHNSAKKIKRRLEKLVVVARTIVDLSAYRIN